MTKLLLKLLSILMLGMTMMANTVNTVNTTNLTGNLTGLVSQIPPELNGWKKTGETVYTPKTLFEYIDGGAELYISYDFQQMLALKYEKEGESEITLDIFDMQNSFNAFGVFSHSREVVDHTIAEDVESEYADGLLTFWKGKYYVSIMAYPETPEKKELVLALGRKVTGLITEPGLVPPIIAKLPRENLVKESIRYFHHYIWLNSHFYISDDNILHIDKDTDAVLAKYKEEKDNGSYFVLLVFYPEPAKADAAYQSFLKSYLPDAQNGMKKLEDGRWTGCKIEGTLVTVVLNAPTAEKVKEVLNRGGNNEQ